MPRQRHTQEKCLGCNRVWQGTIAQQSIEAGRSGLLPGKVLGRGSRSTAEPGGKAVCGHQRTTLPGDPCREAEGWAKLGHRVTGGTEPQDGSHKGPVRNEEQNEAPEMGNGNDKQKYQARPILRSDGVKVGRGGDPTEGPY